MTCHAAFIAYQRGKTLTWDTAKHEFTNDEIANNMRSRANNAKRRERLKDFDVTEAQIARLHGPIGLYIGSRTPPEIAISILAEVTAVKNGVALPELVTIAVAKEKQAPSVACETD